MNNGKYKDGETVKKIIEAIREGCTYKEAYTRGGISMDTFYTWMKGYSEFSELVKTAREEAETNRIAQLEASLYKRATGYSVKEKRSELVANPNGGAPMIIKQTITEKEIAPDTGAIIFALTNKDPERWKNKLNTEHSGEVGTGLKIIVESEEDRELFQKALEKLNSE